MSYESVNITVTDAALNPLSNVVVKVLSTDGKLVFTQALSDSLGTISLLLPDGQYQVRFYKYQVLFTNPALITVSSGPNNFSVVGTPFTPPVATDPRMCLCSGFFRSPDGSAAVGVDIQFIAKFNPILLDGSAMLTERITIRTDQSGYAETLLVRFAQYDVTVTGFEDTTRIVNVPDLPSVNLPDLIFPVVYQVIYSPAPPFAVPLNNALILTPTVVTTDGRVLDNAFDVLFKSDNPNILSVNVAVGTITLAGVSAGTANLVATRQDTSIIRIPNTPIVGSPAAAIIS